MHLLLDIGGVLMRRRDYAPGISNLRIKLGIDPKVEQKLAEKNTRAIDLGIMDFEENIKELNMEMKKVNPKFKPISSKQYFSTFFRATKHNSQLVEAIRNLDNLKIHIFTNNFEENLNNYKKNMKLEEWTDNVISSHHYKISKPYPKFYEIALKKIGAKPGECILLDDNPKNIATANKLGIYGVQYKTNIRAIKDIENILKKQNVTKK